MTPTETRRTLAIGTVALMMCTACAGQIVTMRPLSVRSASSAPGSGGTGQQTAAQFGRLVAVARARGYRLQPLQYDRTRFGMLARYNERGASDYPPFRIAVECNSLGTCVITPLGPRVETIRGDTHVPRAMRDELVALQQAMQQAAFSRER